MFEHTSRAASQKPISPPVDLLRAPGSGILLDSALLRLELAREASSAVNLHISLKSKDGRQTTFGLLRNVDSGSVESIQRAASNPLVVGPREVDRIHDQLQIIGALIEPLECAEEKGAIFESAHGISLRDAACRLSELLIDKLEVEDLVRLLNVVEAAPGIVLVSSRSQFLLAHSFLRLQEHYESPEFKGRYFSLDEFKSWYSLQDPGMGFGYCFDWGGFNLPGSALLSFESAFKDQGHPAERALRAKLSAFKGVEYVIGSVDFDTGTLRHELAHALFAVSRDYRSRVADALHGVDLSKITGWLTEQGYDQSVFADEVQAYLNEDPDDIIEYGFGTEPVLEASAKIRAIYNSLLPENLKGLDLSRS